jgi:hypothetical protein
VTDENVIFDRDPFTDEAMAGNLTVLTDCGIFLNLYECPDLGVVAYLATVEVNKLG